jgi:ABC-type transport system involved in multi-copper enzyme maturation permease subunit
VAVVDHGLELGGGRPLPRFARLELFKLRRRPMTFIMLAILYGLSIGVPALFYVTLSLSGSGVGDDDGQVLIDRLVFPDVLLASVENTLSFGIPLLIILTAATFGGEFAWGTIRLLLARGESRGEYVLSKTVAIAAWWFVALIGASALGIGIGALLGRFEDPAVTPALSSGDAAALLARLAGAWLGSMIYVAITASITVRLRSTAFGLAAGLMIFYGERIVGGLLSSLDIALLEWLVKLGANYNLRVVVGGEGVENPLWFGWGILVIYTCTSLVGTIRVLRSRDVTGPTSV